MRVYKEKEIKKITPDEIVEVFDKNSMKEYYRKVNYRGIDYLIYAKGEMVSVIPFDDRLVNVSYILLGYDLFSYEQIINSGNPAGHFNEVERKVNKEIDRLFKTYEMVKEILKVD